MSPQLSTQQLEAAIRNLQARVDAKKLEAHSYKALSLHPSDSEAFKEALTNLFTAKAQYTAIDVQELELGLKAMKQMASGVVGASMVIDPNHFKV